MRIAILYICTGNYTIFWDGFYASCEKYFLSAHERHYFVFTDGAIAHADSPRVHRIEQARLGWPYDTLKRFHIFSCVKEKLASFDYIFFLNANVLFMSEIAEEILPSEQEGIVVVQHPGFFYQPRKHFHYDGTPGSRAYIAEDEGEYYVCGGVNGGHARDYLHMIEVLREAVDADEQQGLIARWHDESHINRYIVDHPHKLLSPAYCYPEERHIPFEEKILILNKDRFGGHNFLRMISGRPVRKQAKAERISFLGRAVRLVRLLWHLFRFSLGILIPFYRSRFAKIHFDIDNRQRIRFFLKLPLSLAYVIQPAELCEAMRLRNIPAGSVMEIYACHALEYAAREDMASILRAWHSALCEGGVIRIVGWDRAVLEADYNTKVEMGQSISFLSWFAETYGEQAPCLESIVTFLTFDEIAHLLESIGYYDIVAYPLVPHFCNSPMFADELYEVEDSSLVRGADRRYISFSITARKGTSC